MLSEQGRACRICRQEFTAYRRVHVDHDHACCPQRAQSCGRCVRALLCEDCNLSIGRMRDDPDRLRRAADYLEEHRGTRPE